MENRRFAFLSPLWGDLGATYDDHLGLIGKQHLATKVQLTLAGSPLSSGIPCGAEKNTSNVIILPTLFSLRLRTTSFH